MDSMSGSYASSSSVNSPTLRDPSSQTTYSLRYPLEPFLEFACHHNSCGAYFRLLATARAFRCPKCFAWQYVDPFVDAPLGVARDIIAVDLVAIAHDTWATDAISPSSIVPQSWQQWQHPSKHPTGFRRLHQVLRRVPGCKRRGSDKLPVPLAGLGNSIRKAARITKAS
jgi:hypothetical protein